MNEAMHREFIAARPVPSSSEIDELSFAAIVWNPVHTILVPISTTCFIGTLITDLTYWKTANMLWTDMSAWLVTVGVLASAFTVIAGVIDFFGNRNIRESRASWIHGLGTALALILSIFNALIHSRDAYTSVVPTGLILSTLVVLIVLGTAWNGWAMMSRYRAALREAAPR